MNNYHDLYKVETIPQKIALGSFKKREWIATFKDEQTAHYAGLKMFLDTDHYEVQPHKWSPVDLVEAIAQFGGWDDSTAFVEATDYLNNDQLLEVSDELDLDPDDVANYVQYPNHY